MKKVTKLAAQLQPGDIFDSASGRAVVLFMGDSGADGRYLYSAVLNRQPIPLNEPPIIVGWDAAFTVEVPDAPTLTPAQERADDLVALLQYAVDERSCVGGLPAWVTRAESLLDEIRPEPPTVVEALDVMRALIDTILSGGDARAAAKDSQQLLERARRAGLS